MLSSLAAMGFLCLAMPATAGTVILGYNDGGGWFAAPTTTALGATGSDLSTTGGFTQPGLANSFGVGVGTSMSFTMTGYSGVIESLSFEEFNNDCQTGSGFFCTDGTTWSVDETINGGTSNQIYTFGAGQSGWTLLPFSVTLNQTVSSTDTLSFVFTVTGVDPSHVGTSIAAGFNNIDLNVASTPEPGSMGLLGFGILGLGMLVRRKVRA